MAKPAGKPTYDENMHLFERMHDGDNEARREIIERNTRLVWHIVYKRFEGAAMDPEDMNGWGTIGLIKAVDTFDCSLGKKFSSYACCCILNEILMAFRAEKKAALLGKIESLDDDFICREGEAGISLHEVVPSGMDMEADFEAKDLYNRLTTCFNERLNPKERQVLFTRNGVWSSGEDRTQAEAAKIMGISRSYISRIENRAKKKLSEVLSD